MPFFQLISGKFVFLIFIVGIGLGSMYIVLIIFVHVCIRFFFINLKYKFILRLINKISRPQPIFITYFIFYLTKISITLQPILSHFFITSKLSN